MKVVVTGNLGYVGPGLIRELRQHYPDAHLVGYDIGYFARLLTTHDISPECRLNTQHYGDVRKFPEEILEGADAVVSLAAISNDPIGNRFEDATLDINYRANLDIARMAKRQGVHRFVFASSCSVYGTAEDAPRVESSKLDPLTAYAKSKVLSEEGLCSLAGENFQVTCLRFATACGMSDRLRLDLVLNDFVASALTKQEITILSDGTPWRPLIHVDDMARAIRWACARSHDQGGQFLVVNTGSNVWNYQIEELAKAAQQLLPNVGVSVNRNAVPDKRSYRVCFDLFARLAPDHQPQHDLPAAVQGLLDGLNGIGFRDSNYHQSELMRLNVINRLRESGQIDSQLALVV